MSGWDEGGVYYSDQAHSWRDGRGGTDDPEAAASRHSVLQKLKEFIRGFETDKNVFPYRESLVHNPKSLLVDMEDLDAFDPDLPSKLRSAPADYLPLVNHLSLCLLPFPNLWKLCFFDVFSFFFFSQFETAAAEVFVSLRSKVAGETGEMEDPVTGDVQVLLTSREDPVSMRFLGVSGFFFSSFLSVFCFLFGCLEN